MNEGMNDWNEGRKEEGRKECLDGWMACLGWSANKRGTGIRSIQVYDPMTMIMLSSLILSFGCCFFLLFRFQRTRSGRQRRKRAKRTSIC